MSLGKKSTNKKSKKGLIIGVAVLIAVVGVSSFAFLRFSKQSTEAMSNTPTFETMVLGKTSLVNYIAASGTLYSSNSQNVYTTQSYPIKEIYVEVGDVVKAGDVLAVLDMTNLDYDIQQAELNLANSQKSTVESLQTVSNNIENAEASVATSKLNLEKQQLSYDTLKERIESGKSTELINAQNNIDTTSQAIESAQKDVETKTKDYETNKQLIEVGAITQSELDSSQLSMENAITAYETAVSNHEKAIDTYNRTKETLSADLIAAEKDLESAKLNLQNSQNSLSQAQARTANTTSTVESQVISLTKLKEQRLEAEIVAPIDGTITQVNATVGSTGSGSAGSGSSGNILFVVEDMNDLYVSTSIKEFRIGEVKIGQEALVTTDATNGQTFKGVLSFIAPTATETSSTSNVEFEIKVQLKETDPNLKIGMNAYTNIILESKENIYAVGYDAVTTTRSGESFVYTLDNNMVVEIPVTTGLETDTNIEISGDALEDGMVLLENASLVTPGQIIDATNISGGIMQQRGSGADNPSSGRNMPQGGASGDGAPGDSASPERTMQRRNAAGGNAPSGEAMQRGNASN